jgi:predicted DNA-binding transcriptional regulator AlpA
MTGMQGRAATPVNDRALGTMSGGLARQSQVTRILVARKPAMSASNDNDQLNLAVVSPTPADAERGSAISDLIDEPALAARLGVSRSTLQSWRYAGRGPRFIKLGRMIRYRNADVDAFLRANTRGTAA